MLISILILLIVLYLIASLYLTGPDLTIYDSPTGQWFDNHEDDAAATKRFLTKLSGIRKQIVAEKSIKGGFQIARKVADELSDDLETDTHFQPININGLPCEWAIRENSDHSKRILFLHGGAFIFGSPKGHRAFSDQLAKITNGVVLSVDYRMLPEHKRGAATEDAQIAYNWLLENGPEGPSNINKLIIAGDSAGGNLTLMLSAWSKTNCAKRPDAVIAFSPNADMTLSSPTVSRNQKTDKMLGEGLGLLTRFPMPIRVLLSCVLMRCNPANPLASPLFQNLSDLPPTLIHASSNEMLLGDAIRYTNKARVSGSNVKLQVWKNQLHDWHLINMGYGSANAAWTEVEKFLAENL